mgnify:FL=1
MNPYFARQPGINQLTMTLLENRPEVYYEVLKSLSNVSEGDSLKEKLNEKPYATWESNHIFALCRLVGKMNQEVLDGDYEVDSYYGSRNNEGIDIELATSILKMIVDCGGDILDRDYYGNSIVHYLSHPESSRFYRTNNEEFVNVVKSIYESTGEEGVPP